MSHSLVLHVSGGLQAALQNKGGRTGNGEEKVEWQGVKGGGTGEVEKEDEQGGTVQGEEEDKVNEKINED